MGGLAGWVKILGVCKGQHRPSPQHLALEGAFRCWPSLGLLSVQVSPGPIRSIPSLQVSISFVFLSSPSSLPPSLRSSSSLAGRGRGRRGSSTLRPPWGLLRREARRASGEEREGGGREREKGRNRRALRVSECASVSECECRALPLPPPQQRVPVA